MFIKALESSFSDPNFMKLRSRRMIFLPSLRFHTIYKTATGSDMMIKLLSPSINPKTLKEMTIVGSFNGIILLVVKYWDTILSNRSRYDIDMILYNPLTGKFKKVPDRSRSLDSHSKYVYGFGYGTTTDDLKIVRLKSSYSTNSKSYEVFSLKTWSWSKPSELTGDYYVYNSYSGTFANGFLYWNAVRTTRFRPSLILALDIKNMVFSEMEIPDGCCFIRLGTYSGRLCMLCSQINMEVYELKVMNGHGFGESWTTVCSFKTTSFTMLIPFASAVGMLCLLDDGKVLKLQPSEKKLVVYDMFRDSCMEVKVLTSFVQVGWLQCVEYVESLISPSAICSVSI